MRVFVAINPTAEKRARLAEALRRLHESDFPVRWLPASNVHLTLKFLGEISEDGVPDVCSGVAGAVAGIRAFDMAVDGFGAFPSLRRPSVVWTGIELNPSLERVQKSVEEALCELGYPREERRFKPHLTVGRAHKRASPSDFRGFEALVGQLSYRDTYRVSAIDVMQSRLKPTGAVYDVVHSARLEG